MVIYRARIEFLPSYQIILIQAAKKQQFLSKFGYMATNKNNNFNGPNAPRDPVFSTDIRTQNTRLVTPRQRQEIYALNRVMTRLENEKFKRFCHEKGFRGDMGNGEADVVEYDIFM